MLVCVFFCAACTRDRGCSVHPVFPAPSLLNEGGSFGKPPAHHAARMRMHVPRSSSPAHAGDPVRRGLSAQTVASLEYWIVRSSRTMTSESFLRIESEPHHVIASEAKQSMLRRVWRDGLLRCARNDGGWNRALFHHADLAEIFQHAGMDQFDIRRGRDRVRRRGLAA